MLATLVVVVFSVLIYRGWAQSTATTIGSNITTTGTISAGTTSALSSLSIQGASSSTGTGTISSSGTTVTGSGTSFLTELHAGDVLDATGYGSRIISAISSNTSLTITNAFSTNLASGTSFSFRLPLARFINSSGTTKVAVNALGLVGIGTESPSGAVHVLQTVSTGPGLIIQSASDAVAVLRLNFRDSKLWEFYAGYTPAGSDESGFAIYDRTNDKAPFYISPSDNLYLGGTSDPTTSSAVFINGTTKLVGIGTTDPQTGLNLASTAANNQAVIRTENTQGSGTNVGLWIIGGATNANWLIGTNRGDIAGAGDNLMFYKNAGTGGTKLVIQDNGNVGIGTTSPGAKLQVTGGNIYTSTAGNGLVVKSPDGNTCKTIGIDNAGAILLSAITCP